MNSPNELIENDASYINSMRSKKGIAKKIKNTPILFVIYG